LKPIRWIKSYWIPFLAFLGLLLYFGLRFFPTVTPYETAPLILVIIAGGAPLIWKTGREIYTGKFNVDIIAIASIFGGLAIGQYLPAAIIVLMMSGGEALETYALNRASNSLAALLKRKPQTANLWDGKEYQSVPVETVRAGDRLLIKPGEAVPVDAEVTQGSSDFNESLLTGESVPVIHGLGDRLLSGSINLTGPVTVEAISRAEESTFSKIVVLVEKAQARKGSIQRIADRFGIWFTPVTVAFVLLTYLFTRNFIFSYAVLVIATPCPLILATPVAIVAGIGRAARLGIIVKSGASLEGLARAKTVLFDKTGTLTAGTLELARIERIDSHLTEKEALRLAATLAQLSNHVVARSVLQAAKHRGIGRETVEDAREVPGGGVIGTVAGAKVMIGNQRFLAEDKIHITDSRPALPGELFLYLAAEGRHLATFILRDAVRKESRSVIRKLKAQYGMQQLVMLTGDRQSVARSIAAEVGITEIQAELKPEDKLHSVERAVRNNHRQRQTVIMVGDGINDAPALERADIGVAMGKQGGDIAVESADVVLLSDRLDRLTDAIRIGREVLRIAGQGIWFGMGCSFIGMVLAAFGFIPPVVGAVAQEVIDVIVILNALRVLRV
ncbi:cadmium-translocating P-type ATPase, partial [Patescibacteria group bacterium]|nr:cadmium-translocating P-type ATPase [Patescibacteria group bacterium]